MQVRFFLAVLALILLGCQPPSQTETDGPTLASYFDNSGRDDVLTGGVKMIPVETPKGTFQVWTKRVGNNPDIKVLILHGGPGMTHEYLEPVDSYFPGEAIEYYHYDQLGSYRSSQPGDSTLWDLARCVEEVEQVRKTLQLDSTNFYLYGHSWGGILGLEYALKYQDNLKGLIISNMMCSIPAYRDYAYNVLGPAFGDSIYQELMNLEKAGDYGNPRYLELIYAYHYPQHVLRMPMESWPEPLMRSLKHINHDMYVYMQGESEFGVTQGASLADWDRSGDLGQISVPTLTIGATHDTMDPEHMKWMASQVQNGRYLHCPNGSHCAFYDDQETYFNGVIAFIQDVNEGRF